jgi:hypothetical protein
MSDNCVLILLRKFLNLKRSGPITAIMYSGTISAG